MKYSFLLRLYHSENAEHPKQGGGTAKFVNVFFANSFAQQAGLRKENSSGHSVIHLCCFPVSFLPNVATFLHLKKREGKKKLWSGKS